MDNKERASLKKQIKQMIKNLRQEIEEMQSHAAPVTPENSIGRISRMDAINNKSVVEASLRNRTKKLSKLQLALSKIDDADFGICSHCKKTIQSKRLMLMPQSDRCVSCASRR